ncbi:MAG: sarcosine oxidase subunit gamma [Rhizobiaceae bacterium]|nr:sarcosine oxidase subunit gamma [Rhizobiaceae bacterium]
MADFSWTPVSPLQAALKPGRLGEKSGPAGLKLTELTGFSLMQVQARRGRWAETEAAAQGLFGVSAPANPAAVEGSGATLVWSGPQQFLALFPAGYGADWEKRLADAFAGSASLSDQTGGRAMIRIQGARARDMLAKVCSVDLHPRAFATGAAAATSVDHTGVNLWRRADDAEGAVFDLIVFSTFAGSLWHTLVDHAAEFGVEAGRHPA